MKLSSFFYLLAGLVLTSSAQATILDATDSGWYHPSRGHESNNTNYAAGPYDTYRNWFIFDLSGHSGTVNSATLRLEVDPGWINGAPQYEIYDVTTNLSTLTMSHAAGTETDTIHADLGSGIFYGGGTVTNAVNFIEFNLNANALSSINANPGGLWALGGRNGSTLDGSYAFWNTGSNVGDYDRQLLLNESTAAVPTPASLLLLIAGLLILPLSSRKWG